MYGNQAGGTTPWSSVFFGRQGPTAAVINPAVWTAASLKPGSLDNAEARCSISPLSVENGKLF